MKHRFLKTLASNSPYLIPLLVGPLLTQLPGDSASLIRYLSNFVIFTIALGSWTAVPLVVSRFILNRTDLSEWKRIPLVLLLGGQFLFSLQYFRHHFNGSDFPFKLLLIVVAVGAVRHISARQGVHTFRRFVLTSGYFGLVGYLGVSSLLERQEWIPAFISLAVGVVVACHELVMRESADTPSSSSTLPRKIYSVALLCAFTLIALLSFLRFLPRQYALIYLLTPFVPSLVKSAHAKSLSIPTLRQSSALSWLFFVFLILLGIM